jgi:hypothetical protein
MPITDDKPQVAFALYDAAHDALAEAHRVDEPISIRDKAVAMQTYAKQAQDMTLITQATEIGMRAERRAGELLIEMAERDECRTQGQGDGKGRLRVRSIGEAAALEVNPRGTGYVPVRAVRMASPIRETPPAGVRQRVGVGHAPASAAL